MMDNQGTSFDDYFRKSTELAEKSNVDYLIIGGIAVGVWGEARFTEDIDFIIFTSKKDVRFLLKKAKDTGFHFEKNIVNKDIKTIGVFKLFYKNYHLDFLIASTELEKSALKRKIAVKVFDKSVFVPSKEDLVLLKVVAGREKDLLDAKGIAARHNGKFDEKYLVKWAQALSDEAEDMRIYNEIKRLLNA